MKTTRLWLLGLIGVLFCFLIGGWVYREKVEGYPRAISWSGKEYAVEVADTPALRERGLGGRDNLCTACAMLFVFSAPGNYGFWMKDMRFPLDIVWLLQGQVVHIERHIDPHSTKIFLPETVADTVVEVNAFEAESLKEGDRIEFLR